MLLFEKNRAGQTSREGGGGSGNNNPTPLKVVCRHPTTVGCRCTGGWRASPTRLSKSITSRSVKEGNSNTCSRDSQHTISRPQPKGTTWAKHPIPALAGRAKSACLQVGNLLPNLDPRRGCGSGPGPLS